MNNEVIAKKYNMRVPLTVIGIILLVLSVVSLIAFILSGFMIGFIFPCAGMGIGGVLVIAMVSHNKKLPKDLIIANDMGFVIVETNKQIPYQSVRSVDAKYNYRIVYGKKQPTS